MELRERGIVMFNLSCQNCGKAFSHSSRNKMTCCKKCRYELAGKKASQTVKSKPLKALPVVTANCSVCGSEFALTRKDRKLMYKSTCSNECRRKVSADTMRETNKKHASARMKSKNPMHRKEIREKVSRSLKRIKHAPSDRGGNGRGLTIPQSILLSALGNGWIPEYIQPTRDARGLGLTMPNHFKIDIANPAQMIAIEVDGNSHLALSRKEQDERKETILRHIGWKVIRFKNDVVIGDLESCLKEIYEAA